MPSRYKTVQKLVSKPPFGYYTNKDFVSSKLSTATVDTADEAGEQIDLKEICINSGTLSSAICL